MIQKILYWENFLKMFQNGPIRKVIMIKVIFEDFLFFPQVILAGHLKNFRKILSKKHNGPFIEIGLSDRLHIAYSECF